MFKKLFTAGISVVLSASIAFAVKNNKAEPNNLKYDFVSSLPYSVTNSLYRYASQFNDDMADVDNALISWINDETDFSELPFFNAAPTEYNADTLRKSKDYFYVLAYLQQYILQHCATAPIPTFGYDMVGPTTYDNLRMCADHFSEAKNDVADFFQNCESDQPVANEAYGSISSIYLNFADICDVLGTDIDRYTDDPLDSFVLDAKYSLKHLAAVKAYDVTNNEYVINKSFVGFWNNILNENVNAYGYEMDCKLFDDILFDVTVRAEDLLKASYIAFDTDEIDNFYSLAQLEPDENQKAIWQPYMDLIKKNTYLRFLNLNTIINSYADVKDLSLFFLNNCGPLMYKIVDMIEAIMNDDFVNVALLALEVEEDMELLFENMPLPDSEVLPDKGASIGGTGNRKDLRVEKYLAKVRLGKALEGYEGNGHTKIYESYCQFIDATPQPSTEQQYIDRVNLINQYFEMGYQELNVNVVSDYRKLNVAGIDNPESLVSSINDRYSVNVAGTSDGTIITAMNNQVSSDYEQHPYGLRKFYFDINIFNEITKDDIDELDTPMKMYLIYDEMANSVNQKVYRYDPILEEAVLLDKGVNDKGYDYYTISGPRLAIVTKYSGSFAFVCNDKEVDETISGLQETIEDLTEQISDLTDEIGEKTDIITDLQGQIDALEGQIDALEGEIDSLETVNSNLESANSSLEGRIATLEGEINTLEGEVNELNDQITSLEEDIANLEGQVSDLENQVGDLETQIGVLEDEKINLQNENHLLEVQIASLEGQLETLEDEKADLISQNETLDAEIQTLNGQLQALESEKEALAEENEDLSTQISLLENQILALQGEKANLMSQISALENQISSLNAQIATLNNEKAALASENAALEARITTLEAQVENLQAQIATLQGNITQLTSEKTALQESVSSLTAELTSVKGDLEDKKSEILSLNKVVADKSTLSLIFIILTCVFMMATGAFLSLYLKERNDHKVSKENETNGDEISDKNE